MNYGMVQFWQLSSVGHWNLFNYDALCQSTLRNVQLQIWKMWVKFLIFLLTYTTTLYNGILNIKNNNWIQNRFYCMSAAASAYHKLVVILYSV